MLFPTDLDVLVDGETLHIFGGHDEFNADSWFHRQEWLV